MDNTKIKPSNEQYVSNLRHTCAHLLAKAVRTLWPGAHNAIGPAIENGFYQDFDMGDVKISEDDLHKIEQKMREILPSWKGFTFREVTLKEAEKLFGYNPYKVEMAKEFAKDGKKLMTNDPGDFLDLCKMGHVENPSKELAHFKLLSVAGAYWRGSEKNKMLTRIYGTCFPTKEELDKYLWQQEEAKKRDHRKIAKELDLIVFSDLVGAGLPLYTPKGAILRSEVYNFSRALNKKIGYEETALPGMNRAQLFKVSGHYEKYKADMLLVTSHYSEEEFYLKPMNCPQHCVIYGNKPRSYRDLPIRLSDFSVLYRDERPGEINGLFRSRAFTQDDGHCFCREDQIGEEFKNVLSVVDEALSVYGFIYKIRLSLRDPKTPEKYLGDEATWTRAEAKLQHIVKDSKVEYFEGIGEAAIYGPKLDFMAVDSLGREWQLSTIQLDMIMPGRFGLTYTDSDGSQKTPFMVHRAIIGSERFIAILIEHYAGAFPLWLAPVHTVVIPIAERHELYARETVEKLRFVGIRAELDDRNESMQGKIRDATLQKVPYMGIIGDKEAANNTIAIRTRSGEDLKAMDLKAFIARLHSEIEHKS
ncbi:threonine--tRNA ligase [Candidatus Gottesmanbacteria bacterium]|nr:threonine--tRNA ligase [Candidatus Gottesmanbacteria bacterium]